jgi:pilus assembly protein CpaB
MFVMARIRLFIVLALALTAGAVFAVGTANYLRQVPARAAEVATAPVLVAGVALEVGAEVRPEDIRVVNWPVSALPDGAMSVHEEVVGRGVIVPLVANEPFLPMKLASREAGAGLPPVIPPGLRALSVKVNEVIGVAGYVLPGAYVDVVATVSPTTNQQDITSKVVLANVQVLASGTRLERDADKSKPVAVTVVTLLVTPEQAERLTLASTEGKIQLALRNPLDKEAPATRGIRPAALMGSQVAVSAGTRRAAAPPAAPGIVVEPTTVEIIRGDKRAREVVQQE